MEEYINKYTEGHIRELIFFDLPAGWELLSYSNDSIYKHFLFKETNCLYILYREMFSVDKRLHLENELVMDIARKLNCLYASIHCLYGDTWDYSGLHIDCR